MDTLDYLRSAGMVIAFCVTAFSGRKNWMLTDLIVSVVFGAAWFILPTYTLGFQTVGKLNTLHAHVTRDFAAHMLSSAFVWWKTRESRDETVPVTLMTGRVVGNSILLCAMVYAQKYVAGKGVWTEQHIWFGMLGCACWLLGNLIQLLKTKDFGGSFQGDTRLDWHLRIDFYIVFVISVVRFAFPEVAPDFVAKQPLLKGGVDAIIIHMVRAISALSIGYCMTVFNAPMFRYDADKKAVLQGRLVLGLIMWLLLLWEVYKGMLSFQAVAIVMLAQSVIFINAAAGGFFYTRPVPPSLKKN
ncbi:uncharacterized protein LOC106179679 isoform X1 [Lingula anatina]|uniref:Uncharacterized protein LOC106179679 isoform X1 n=1 Tax=Lingula anatina TaxID=7574 RepID=A0A1S3K8U6_LINAN|nr:uncharacterized protein LOC106179679 isoform X1 [Lingula anatina]|eukprot:XP_013418864.1 uncharacterized protein LOC106179679 isoform X1 [Lingula anatina]